MASTRPGEIFIRLEYSTDGGTTWLPSTKIDLRAGEYTLTRLAEGVIEQRFEEAGRIRRVRKGRGKLVAVLSEANFGAADTNDAKLIFVEDWLVVDALLRVQIHDGAASPAGLSVDGRAYFSYSAGSPNTNYVVPDQADPEEPDILSDFRKSHTLTLITRDWL